MASSSEISWTDSTFNPWIGCNAISPACNNCYAEAFAKRVGRNFATRTRTSVANWKLPERWNREPFWECSCGFRGAEPTQNGAIMLGGRLVCPTCHMTDLHPARRRVFCASLADVFDNEVPIEWLVDLLDLIRRTPNLDWLLLTKRIGNVTKRLKAAQLYLANENPITDAGNATAFWVTRWLNGEAPENIGLGATIVNQEEADRDIQKLLRVPAAVRFLSIEPMLGPIKLADIEMPESGHGLHEFSPIITGNPLKRASYGAAQVHWVIVGGESGPRARPMHPDWVRSLRDQCMDAGVPFHFKQWGEWAYADGPMLSQPSGMAMRKIGKKAAGRLLDGREWNEFPAAT